MKGFKNSFVPRIGNDFSEKPREKHKAVCSECGKECEVPFKPSENRPVYCAEHWKKRRRY